jgi:tetratricopeptide (TPR) repeat protein
LPVQIQCSSVVIRNDALDRVLDGGAKGFDAIAPNAMSYADDYLSQASFMSPVDAEEFAKSLELRGLNRSATTPDFVVVQAHDQSIEPPCDWLILFQYERRLIATMRGNDSRKVIASAIDGEYDPNAVRHYSAEEIARLFEFVERKENIDTYRKKETGELVYHTRITESPDEIFSRAFETVWRLRRAPGTPARNGHEASALSKPLSDLQSLVAKYPDVAKPSLALGMAWFAIGKANEARRHLERAAELDPTNTIILKELGGVCLDQGDFLSASQVVLKAVAIKPDDPELLGNLAVTQLLIGDRSKAQQTIAHALTKDANDSINCNIRNVIDDVLQGRRDNPKSLLDLMTPQPKKKSFLFKLFGV